MYSTFLTASPGSVLFSRSALLKRKDLCFSCLRLGLIRHRRSKKPHTFFSKSSPRFSRGDPSQLEGRNQRPYNKKLLGTSPALQQEVALPANFRVRSISSSTPGFEAGVRLLQGGRRPSTVRSYDQKWIKFETFTTQVQDDARAPRRSVLPASSQTVVAYLGFLLESDTISVKSLQPYLSVINTVHNVFEYPPPSCGHLVKLACKGFAELQGSAMLQPQQVTAFPAEHMFAIVQFGSSSPTTFCHVSCL
jgi:hypothetical protein